MEPADASRLVAPDGSTVERRAVSDPDIYRLELERVFRRGWIVVAHESQLREPGDFVTRRIGEEPVIVVRERSGTISVLLNSCSHRASRVCRVDQGSASTFTCPNHGWTFGSDGRLLGVPHQTAGYDDTVPRDARGLPRARVEVLFGLVFATFELDAPDLATHLGDTADYLETVFDRYADGTEVLDGALRSIVACNWKLALENLGTDLQHPEFAHGSFMDLWPDPVMAFMERAEQIVTSSGNPICIGRRPPPYTEPEHVLRSITDAAERREVNEWFERTNREAIDRLGAERADIYVFTGSVYPSFSFLPGVSAVFSLHPLGPERTEWWSWCLVPSSAPRAVREYRRRTFMLTCGPGGIILAEDAENWADMTRTGGTADHGPPLLLDRGMEEEYTDPVLPGRFTAMRSEHVQRQFWMNWRRSMATAG